MNLSRPRLRVLLDRFTKIEDARQLRRTIVFTD
jgi:hypothetical protein